MTNAELFNQLMMSLPVHYIICGLLLITGGFALRTFLGYGCDLADAIECRDVGCIMLGLSYIFVFVFGILFLISGVYLLVTT